MHIDCGFTQLMKIHSQRKKHLRLAETIATMVEFWGLFVVFSACAAFQITESRIQHAYRPSYLSASDELADISNSISDSSKDDSDSVPFMHGNAFEITTDTISDLEQETQTNSPPSVTPTTEVNSAEESTTLSSTTPKKRVSLKERRQKLSDFTDNALTKYAKHYVGNTRNSLKEVIAELEATTEKSDALKVVLFEIKNTLSELNAFDIESDDLEEASSIAYDLIEKFDWPKNEPPELVAALEKVGWLDMRWKLNDETVAIENQFQKELNHFVSTLTPWERLREADLVDLHRRFNEDSTVDKWELFDEYRTYFD